MKLLINILILKEPYIQQMKNVLVFIHDDIRGWIDNWFQNNNRVPKEMKREYNRYKQDYLLW